MLHVPSLTIYTVLEVAIVNQNRSDLKEMIERWRMVKSPHFLTIHETFWNSPEGHLSIVTDHMNGGTLNVLREYAGAIPEQILKEIAS